MEHWRAVVVVLLIVAGAFYQNYRIRHWFFI